MSFIDDPSAVNLSAKLLDGYLGQNISEICPHGFKNNKENHCSHFVCHVMNISAGSPTCVGMGEKKAKDRLGVCIKVQELFAACPKVGNYAEASSDEKSSGLLIFVLAPQFVDLKRHFMRNVPKKHVGIAFQGKIWHYSNTKDRVVTASPEDFKVHYSGQINSLFFGTFPSTALATSLGRGR